MAPSPQQDAQTQFWQLAQRIEGMTHAWNPNSPQCRFQVSFCCVKCSHGCGADKPWQHYFYNLVDPSQVHLYGRPPNAYNEALWQKAVRENPDPSWCVTVLCSVSFADR